MENFIEKKAVLFFCFCFLMVPVFSQTQNDAVFANRVRMRISGLDNIRDMGGYKTATGRTVKRGLLYRSDTLSKLTQEGIRQFEALNVGAIFDLRDDGEIARKPDPQIRGAEYFHAEIPSNAPAAGWPATDEETIAFFKDPATLNYYVTGSRYMMNSRLGRESLKTILNTALRNNGRKAMIWHCSGGKDRTGYISAIFLSLMGVDNETVIREYLLTNEDRKEFDDQERIAMDRQYFHGDRQMTAGFLAVQQARRENVDVFLSELQSIYGTVDNYLIVELGFTQAELNRIKAIYTE
jgi:protein-tyrosine phosphatase